MTVCVAAICENGWNIIGASDRMITAIAQFQSPERKVFALTTSIVAMWSGDSAFLRSILNDLRAEVSARVSTAPEKWLEVGEVAYMLQAHFNRARSRLIDQSVLSPFGLTTETFRKTHRQMDQTFALDIADRMRSYRAPDIAALIVGMDLWGAHIYEFENLYTAGDVHCHDATGFRAIGSGGWHAESQLMLDNYGPSRSLADALFLVYLAKKRAEVASGVGSMTDVFFYRPRSQAPPQYDTLVVEAKQKLDEIYVTLKASEQAAIAGALSATGTWLNSLQPPPPPAGQAIPVTPGSEKLTPTDHAPGVAIKNGSAAGG